MGILEGVFRGHPALGEDGLAMQAARLAAANLGMSVSFRSIQTLKERRKYAGDPAAYFSDVLGFKLSAQQEDALALVEEYDRVLLPSGNNLGKTFLLGGYGVYRMDTVAALPDEILGVEEQGGRVLLPGPDHRTVLATIYSSMMEAAAHAERRGFKMPGYRSEKSVLWYVQPRWQVEAFSPPQKVGESVAHQASGRHHRNQCALIEEGQGVREALWTASEGMCSGAGNKIISSFNPTESRGPAYRRAMGNGWKVLHWNAFDHINIRTRRDVIPGAVDHKKIDARVRDREECAERGPYPGTEIDPERHDFAYAVPDEGKEDAPPRDDGILGAAGYPPKVYRPRPVFIAQVFGQWPKTTDTGLVSPAAWDAAVKRWKARRRLPLTPPDQIGCDPAREGQDDSATVERWGPDAEAALQAYAEAQKLGEKFVLARQSEEQRIVVGEPVIHPKSDGVDLAERVAKQYPQAGPVNFDEGGVGSSAYDHWVRVMLKEGSPSSFSAVPAEPTPGEPYSENYRTQISVRMALLINRGLADVPPDEQLREEALAMITRSKSRVVTRILGGVKQKVRVPSVILASKEELYKVIGRSPNKWDALCLSCNAPGLVQRKVLGW